MGVYALNTVRELITLDPDVEYLLLVQGDDSSFDFGPRGNVSMIQVKSKVFRKLPMRFLLEQLWIPWLAYKYRVSVVHSLHYSFPLMPMRAVKVVTLHDMTMFLMPEVHEAKKVTYFTFFIRQAAVRANHLIFVSHSCRADFNRILPKASASQYVVHLGRDLSYQIAGSQKAVSRIRAKYNLTMPFVLYIGTIEPRKNLARLLEAFSLICHRHETLLLTIAGKQGWMSDNLKGITRDLNLEERVRFLGFIDDADKPSLIQAAEVFAYPSLYEGFGIPLLEAISCGVPTLSSNTSSMPEVADDAAMLVDPTSVEQIARGLDQLLSDPALRSALATKGPLRAEQFDWRRTATQTLEVYRTALLRATHL